MKLDIQGLNKSLNDHLILSSISLSTECDVLGVLGPSGSGKSTLLRVLAGLLTPDHGEVFLNDKKIDFTSQQALIQHRRGIGVVFQAWNLFPHLTALENIILPLIHVHNLSVEEAKERGQTLLKRFDLMAHGHKRPFELSGGQCQRVALIRAAAIRPHLLLLDEPTSALDPYMTTEVLDLIFEFKREKTSIILISHHLPFMKKIADKIAFIDHGKLVELEETNQLFDHPKNEVVAHYLHQISKYESL